MPPTPQSQIKAEVMHCYDPSKNEDKVYVIWIENRGGAKPYFVCGGYGARTIKGMLKVDPKGEFETYREAEHLMCSVQFQKGKKGYRNVEEERYSSNTAVRVTFNDFVNPSKIDCSRIIGYSVGAETVTAAPVSAPVKKQQKVQVGSGRVSRSVEL